MPEKDAVAALPGRTSAAKIGAGYSPSSFAIVFSSAAGNS